MALNPGCQILKAVVPRPHHPGPKGYDSSGQGLRMNYRCGQRHTST